MTNTELLPCFGCKSTNIEYNHIHKVRWGVHCIDCDLHTDPDSKTKEDAAIHWNKYKRYHDDIPERCFMQDRTDEYDDGYCNGYDAGIRADKAAPVERIELLENSLSWFDKFIAENGLDENGGLLRIRKAARAYLKLQGGE